MRLADLISEHRVLTRLTADSKADALEAVSSMFEGVCGLDAKRVLRVLSEREELASTGVGSGVAIPHGRMSGLQELLAAVAVSPSGVPFDAIDGGRVHILVVVLAPERHTGDHLKVLARVSRMLRVEKVRERLIQAEEPERLLEMIQQEDSGG